MSKAFMRDDADTSGEDIQSSFNAFDVDALVNANLIEDTSPAGSKNYLTREGYLRLKDQLQDLTAAGEARESDLKIRSLHKLIDTAQVIDPERQTGDRVIFGATVTVLDEDEIEHVYRIVGIPETDVSAGKVSWISPIGRALLQAKVGDFVTVKTPHGDEDLEVRAIEFKPIH